MFRRYLLDALQDLQELVSHCLQKEPAERWTARQLLKHRFWRVRLCDVAHLLWRRLRILFPAARFGGSYAACCWVLAVQLASELY